MINLELKSVMIHLIYKIFISELITIISIIALLLFFLFNPNRLLGFSQYFCFILSVFSSDF